MECAFGARNFPQQRIARIAAKIAEMMMLNIKERMGDAISENGLISASRTMTLQEMENGRRQIARDCRNELKIIMEKEKLTTEIEIRVLHKYLNKFKSLMTDEQLEKYYPATFLSYTARLIGKEMNND
ncbi:hypothetical protein AB7282_00115 [Providencia huaxiensis]|uniref:hypothetical protein n=2 Tax=Providencia huaxiensis TaxID=2027290 RepID=UPI0034E38D7B